MTRREISAKLRISQQVIAGLLKDRARYTDEIAKTNHLMQWGQACYTVLRGEVEKIDKAIEKIRSEYP